jgi:uncharacterized protein (TIGR00251 family)
MEWLKSHLQGSLILLHIQPGASKNEFCGLYGNRLKIKIKSPPRDGEANSALVKFLSDLLKVPGSKIHILRGESSRKKDLLIELSAEELSTLIKKDV